MVNKRLLIKNLLAHTGENSFYDKKRKVDLSSREGKAKFLKHICALSNSNPQNRSYIVIGVEDENNVILGVDFFDDSKIQNLVNAYLENPPLISYENIPFPHLPDSSVVGLVSIAPNHGLPCSLRKSIWKYPVGTTFIREGSISLPIQQRSYRTNQENQKIVASIESHSRNSMELTLDGVFDFFRRREDLQPVYKVFKEYFIVCWSGKREQIGRDTFYSRVDIALINEQVKLFFSEHDKVVISHNSNKFQILEYVQMGLNNNFKHYPLEETTIFFRDNATYTIESNLLFEPPQFEKENLYHFYNHNNTLLTKLRKQIPLLPEEERDLKNIPNLYLICHFNGFEDAIEKLEEARSLFRNYDRSLYQLCKDSLRILRKVKYN